MRNRNEHHSYERAIVSAVETLSSIAELEFDSPIAIAEEQSVQVGHYPLTFHTVHWLHKENADKMMRVVRETFRVILNYLRKFYKREVGRLIRHESVEGIKTIMVLVGDAAKKLDRFSKLIHDKNLPSVKESTEFQELYSFYQRKIAPIVEQESLVKWMKMLPVQAVLETTKVSKPTLEREIEHLFIDLESLKNDNDYDLFLIRKEDGSRFFNPRLLKSVKLVCNFEEYFSEKSKEDPYQVIRALEDKEALVVSDALLKGAFHKIDEFIKATKKKELNDLQVLIYKAIFALFLASHPKKSEVEEFQKSEQNYFCDFQKFLRQIVTSHDYQKLQAYPAKTRSILNQKVCEIVEDWIRFLYGSKHIPKDLIYFLNEIIQKETHEDTSKKLDLSGILERDFHAVAKGVQQYGHTPLVKILNTLQDLEIRGFDPLLQQNLPSSLFEMRYPGKTLTLLKIPSPTQQDYINKAVVTEEFKGFLRNLSHDKPKRHLLLFNLQDRTSFREFARSHALEELSKKEDFQKVFSVVTLTKDSEFYFQLGDYHDLNQADVFINHLLDHAESESSGYYYPEKVKKELFPHFAKEIAKNIHEIFFNNRNALPRSSRLDFIELFYLFLELKIIDILKPDCVSFTCKDSLDIGIPQTVELYLAMKLFNHKTLTNEELNTIIMVLFGLPLLVRGRCLFSERFQRLNSFVKAIEEAIDNKGYEHFHELIQTKIKPHYKSDILKSDI